jgi:hypothetical protein
MTVVCTKWADIRLKLSERCFIAGLMLCWQVNFNIWLKERKNEWMKERKKENNST